MKKLIIEHLSKDYKQKGQTIKALDDVSLTINGNQVVGLIGKNGSGKTTFIKSCTNLITFNGSISIEENDGNIRKLCHKDYGAVLEGNRNIYWKLSILENVKYFAGLRGIKFSDIKELTLCLLDKLSLYDKKDCLVETLSRGMKQKTALVCTLAVNTPILFLDEPTLGLDIESRNHLRDFFTTDNTFLSNRLVFITSHDLVFIKEIAKKHYFIQNGRIYDVDFETFNPNIYKIRTDENLHDITNCPNGIKMEGNTMYIDTVLIPLSMAVAYLEHECIHILEIIKMSNDIESFYLNLIKKY
ncbi:MAG: ABC transporter ATP-binding protein [Bacteroidia bacterium]|nr:ABC transporter ATP-binding protein [Bacteroidia bacterium]